MDIRDGRIYTPEEIKIISEAFKRNPIVGSELLEHLIEMKVEPTKKQMLRKPPKVGRNEPCPCKSGKKFKKCCLNLL